MAKDYNDLFDGDDDDYLNGDMIEPPSSPKTGDNEDDADDLMQPPGHVRRAVIDDDDDNSLGTQWTYFPELFCWEDLLAPSTHTLLCFPREILTVLNFLNLCSVICVRCNFFLTSRYWVDKS